MTNITTIIDQESGIQYQGVEDRSSRTGTYPVIGMITGQFRRGRFDKPMTITNENIKAQLGYDPTNPHYMAVQDVLSSGVPSVQVLRVGAVASLICQVAPPYQYGAYILNNGLIIGEVDPVVWKKAIKDSFKLTINDVDHPFELIDPSSEGMTAMFWKVRFDYTGVGDLILQKVVMCASVPMVINKEMM